RTYGFSKSQTHAQAHLDMYVAYYNLVRPHLGLKGSTPGLEAGIVKEAWSIEQLVSMALERSVDAGKFEALARPKKKAPVGRPYEYRAGFRERVEELLDDSHAALAYLQPHIDELRSAEDLGKYRRAS